MGSCIGVFSCKGGVGKSWISANLAEALAHVSGEPTLLVDANPLLGILDLLVGVGPEHSWVDLLPVREEITPAQVEIAVYPFGENLFFLAGPEQLDPMISPADLLHQLDELIAALTGYFHHVILDGWSLSWLAEAPLSSPDLICFVVTPDSPTFRSTARYFQKTCDLLQPGGLILNQWFPGAIFSPDEAEDRLERPVLGVIPGDARSVWKHVNFGESVFSGSNRKMKRALMGLAGMIHNHF